MTIKNAITNVTGSGGTSRFVEGSTRGVLLAGIFEGLNLLAQKTNLLEASEVADFGALAILAAFVLGGLWDKFFKAQ